MNEEERRTLMMVVEQQSRFVDQLGRVTTLLENVVQTQEVQSNSLAKVVSLLEKLAILQEHLDQRDRDSGERLDAVIAVVDDLIRRHSQAPPQES